MEYAEFDAERRRIVQAWGESITDPEELGTAVADLRRAADGLEESARVRGLRYLQVMDDLVSEAREPESEYIRRASDVLLAATPAHGTPAEQRARAEAGIAEITRIAEAAPHEDRAAILDMNEPLATIIATHNETVRDDGAASGGGPLGVDNQTARFATDPAIAPAGRIGAPGSAPVSRPGTSTDPRTPGLDR
ncbi:hypothetical protein [Kribbella sp. NPDC048915]|uniref:hypothetical protein n=1 Tax=Kribbella sp. NPDC048915 TaxID=3155148 RepID=UPI0033CD0398